MAQFVILSIHKVSGLTFYISIYEVANLLASR